MKVVDCGEKGKITRCVTKMSGNVHCPNVHTKYNCALQDAACPCRVLELQCGSLLGGGVTSCQEPAAGALPVTSPALPRLRINHPAAEKVAGY